MKRFMHLALLLVALAACAVGQEGYAQRRINPVKSASKGIEGKTENRNPNDSIDYSKLAHMHDAAGNVILVDTITGKEVADTTQTPETKIPKMKQPLFHAAAVGVDVWDPVMRLFGQHYGLIEFSGELNLHNRYIPVVEVGLGQANYTPDDGNYTYKVPITPYFRIGCNYNFLYNSNPDYMVFAGLRFGWSHFKYEVNDVRLTDGYWGQEAVFNLPGQTSNVTYMQVLFGLRVKVFGPISMGWSIRYKAILHQSAAEFGEPWYIPGYGSRGAITGSFTVSYTLPIKKWVRQQSDPLADTGGPVLDTPPAPADGGETVAPSATPAARIEPVNSGAAE